VFDPAESTPLVTIAGNPLVALNKHGNNLA
jgi:hypothetical protein